MSELPKTLDKEIRAEAKDRCGYCLGEQKYILAWLEIEHIFPRAKGGTSEKENLWLTCPFCNTFKGAQTHGADPKTKRKVSLFNPRKQIWKVTTQPQDIDFGKKHHSILWAETDFGLNEFPKFQNAMAHRLSNHKILGSSCPKSTAYKAE